MAETTTSSNGRRASGDTSGRQGSRRRTGPPFRKPRWPKAYAFALVTGALFLFSWIGQFVFQMAVESNEASQHGQSFAWGEFLPQFFASTLENWQSEFLQLVWQAAGLALFYYWGSSQSRESDERIEAKLDALLRERGLDPENS
ncbi:DUF6766 family protein [Micromonospora costi]|uniref:Uncharacterized protein n=1 Tax=Micromonospora costi TaxID=1530042 RepID=A0A3A9ZWM0_9ACTN|nr:DUF6766 family protein [Micromonospora costi]RKN52600.1 hypothetical protein D7193_22295 [Micromonospora costi]